MSIERRHTFLDIGGGPDISDDQLEVEKLRGVLLARSNPQGNYFILDPHLPDTKILSGVRKNTPNAFFVNTGVELNTQLPFRNEVFDAIEMNFLLVTLAGSMGNNVIPTEEFQEWLKRPLISPKDAPLYSHVIREASRVLKVGGFLTISEKKQRMKRIAQMLGNEGQLNESDFFASCGLTFKRLYENTQGRTWWERRRIRQRQEFIAQGDFIKAEENRVICLELIKTE